MARKSAASALAEGAEGGEYASGLRFGKEAGAEEPAPKPKKKDKGKGKEGFRVGVCMRCKKEKKIKKHKRICSDFKLGLSDAFCPL